MHVEVKTFSVRLAGVTVGISTQHEETFRLCDAYLADGEPDFAVSVMPEDIAFERRKSLRQDERDGVSPRMFTPGYLETLAVLRKVAEQMPEHGVMLVHGSALALDGRGVIFTARSGVGKSTHARLWRERFGERVTMVNDDKPFIRMTSSGAYLCGSPWDGKHRLSSNMTVPMEVVCFLNRAEANRVDEIPSRDAYPLLFRQVYKPQDPVAAGKTLALLDRLLKTVRLYSLRCDTQAAAALTAYEGILKGGSG